MIFKIYKKMQQTRPNFYGNIFHKIIQGVTSLTSEKKIHFHPHFCILKLSFIFLTKFSSPRKTFTISTRLTFQTSLHLDFTQEQIINFI